MKEDNIQHIKECKKLPLPEVIALYADLKAEHDRLKKEASEVYKKMDILRINVIPELMDDKDIRNITLEGVGQVTLQGEIFFSIKAAVRPDAYKWLRENGHEDLITETVNASSGKSWAKECLLSGVSLPDDLFTITPYTIAKLRRIA